MEKIILNIDEDLKKKFQDVCSEMGCTMTEAIIGLITHFITDSTTKTK